MPRTAFSVRFPPLLASALDDFAAAQQLSRSDVVETTIMAATPEDLEEILQTQVGGAPTEKLNLRLSEAAVAHLGQLAGDLPAADFLRRTVTVVLRQEGAYHGEAQEPPPDPEPRAGRRSRPRSAESFRPGNTVHAFPIALVAVTLIAALGFLVWLFVQVFARGPAPPSPPSDRDSRGQIGSGGPGEAAT
jgi:nitrate reductase NapE component